MEEIFFYENPHNKGKRSDMIRSKNSPQVRLATDQHTVQAPAAHSADQAFRIAICHGDASEIGPSRIPIALNQDVKMCH
jgi:hypothetical protein